MENTKLIEQTKKRIKGVFNYSDVKAQTDERGNLELITKDGKDSDLNIGSFHIISEADNTVSFANFGSGEYTKSARFTFWAVMEFTRQTLDRHFTRHNDTDADGNIRYRWYYSYNKIELSRLIYKKKVQAEVKVMGEPELIRACIDSEVKGYKKMTSAEKREALVALAIIIDLRKNKEKETK